MRLNYIVIADFMISIRRDSKVGRRALHQVLFAQTLHPASKTFSQSWQQQPASVQRAMLKHGGLGIARSSGQAYATINQQIRAALAAAGQPALIAPDESTQQALVNRSQALHDAWMTASSDRETTYRAAQTLLTQLRSETPPVSAGGTR